MTDMEKNIIYDCQLCGYKTQYEQVIFIHHYLRKKYGHCKEFNSESGMRK